MLLPAKPGVLPCLLPRAASVLAACAAGQLPPWTRHVVLEHGEWVEFLPRHLHDEAAAAGFVWRGSEGTGAGAGAGSQRGAALTALQRAASLGIPLTAAGAAAGGASTSGGGATAASASAGAWEGTAECRAARVRAAAPKLYPLVWFRWGWGRRRGTAAWVGRAGPCAHWDLAVITRAPRQLQQQPGRRRPRACRDLYRLSWAP